MLSEIYTLDANNEVALVVWKNKIDNLILQDSILIFDVRIETAQHLAVPLAASTSIHK